MESEFSEEKLFEIKANKQPIGKYEYSVPFKTTEIILEKGDRLYLASDGYADQFGGEKGKKFKTKKFKELILRTTCLALAAQKSVLIEEFEKWKGDFEQLDDICIIGIEI
jgi:serine phosphatase RsbU (regulator of sigma subunit)